MPNITYSKDFEREVKRIFESSKLVTDAVSSGSVYLGRILDSMTTSTCGNKAQVIELANKWYAKYKQEAIGKIHHSITKTPCQTARAKREKHNLEILLEYYIQHS